MKRVVAALLGGARLSNRGRWFLAVGVLAFIGAYALGLKELLYVGTLLLALPVIAVLFVRLRRPRLAVTRSFNPHVIQAGNATTVSLFVRNLAPRASGQARWWDAVPWRPGKTPPADLRALQARGSRYARDNSTTLAYDLTPPRRGIFAVGPLTIEVTDAFGLASSSMVAGDPMSVVVTPEVIPLAESGLSIPAGDGESRLVQRRATGDDDDAMTREYRKGDAMRRVHWRASARHGDLMVRQEEQRSFPEARIVIDTRRAGYRDVSTDPLDDEVESAAFEWVVRMLASVAVHLRRVGFLVTIEETGLPQLDSVGRGRRRTWGDEEFLASLAAIALTDDDAIGTRGEDSQHSSRGPIIAVLGSPESETVDWLLRQRQPGELAVAFMVKNLSGLDALDRSFGVPSPAPAIAERLTDAGWLVVPVRSDDDHAAAWGAVVAETGRARESV